MTLMTNAFSFPFWIVLFMPFHCLIVIRGFVFGKGSASLENYRWDDVVSRLGIGPVKVKSYFVSRTIRRTASLKLTFD